MYDILAVKTAVGLLQNDYTRQFVVQKLDQTQPTKNWKK